jgi:hypothetical protein
MSYKLKDLKCHMHFSFGKEIEAILKYLAPTWDIKAQPKGYTKYRKNHEDYQDMEELDEEALLKSFEGHDSTGTCSGSFPLRVSMPHVAQDDRGQGRRPLETLLGAVLGHGIHIGERLAAVNNMSDALQRLNYYSHAMSWFICKTDSSDVQLGVLSMMEANEYKTELGTPCTEIEKKYDEKRLAYLTGHLKALCKYLESVEGPVTFFNKKPDCDKTCSHFNTPAGMCGAECTWNTPERKKHYEFLWETYCVLGHKEEKFQKLMLSLGMKAKRENYNFIVSLKKKRVKKEAL